MMERLIQILHEGGFSCVVLNGEMRTFSQRGVMDLYDLLTHEPEFLNGALIADKVVGKGAAALIALGKVKELYADVISQPAYDLLQSAGLQVSYGQIVPQIMNRLGTGRCPVETLCSSAQSPEDCFPFIEQFVQKLREQK